MSDWITDKGRINLLEARVEAAERIALGEAGARAVERAKREAAERENRQLRGFTGIGPLLDDIAELEATLAAVRKYALDTEDDYVLAILDGERE